ncbi:MAG: DUF1559 domain-containing protein [Gemmataceae bacterium]|nr:DUF1559 domain-containing protein [Gemmataceae bacterium]
MRISTSLANGLLYNTIGLSALTIIIGICACPLESLILQRAFLYFSGATVVCALGSFVSRTYSPVPKRLATGLAIGLVPLGLFWLFLLFLLFAQGQIREMSGRGLMGLNGKSIGFAMHEFDDQHRGFPADLRNAGGPTLSWRVSLCPYVEQMPLYKQFDLTKAWDSPGNRPLVDKMPFTFRSVLFPDSPGNTPWQGFVGPGTAFEPVDGVLTLARDFPDGPSNTIFFVEAQQQVPWSKPADMGRASRCRNSGRTTPKGANGRSVVLFQGRKFSLHAWPTAPYAGCQRTYLKQCCER